MTNAYIGAEISTVVCLYLRTAIVENQNLCLHIPATKQHQGPRG